MAMAEAKAKPVKKEEARVRNIAAVSLALVFLLCNYYKSKAPAISLTTGAVVV
jgi:hypothetical protein